MSRKALLKPRVRKIEWNGETLLGRSLTLREATEWDAKVPGMTGKELLLYILQYVTDCDGRPLFAEDDPELDEIPLDVIPCLAEEIQKISRGGKLETVAKN